MKAIILRLKGVPSLIAMVSIVFGMLGLFMIYQLPAVNEKLFWRVEILKANITNLISPRPEYIPAPEAVPDPAVVITMAMEVPSFTAIRDVEELRTASALEVPDQVFLSGTVHRWQHWNNCGPATLAMTLNYWGWPGTQANTAAALKPNRNDRNVSPHELVEYAEQVGYHAVTRVNGTPEKIRQFLAAGVPVIIERDLLLEEEGWAGHYALIIGYDKAENSYVTQDTFQGAELTISGARLDEIWSPFNYRYAIVYPAEKEIIVQSLLGADNDPLVAHQSSVQNALVDIENESGVRQAMAYFNLGISLQAGKEAAAATAAFDQARTLNIPFRMLWYQPDIYAAYYDAERYTAVVTLTSFALNSNSYSEEAYYWRGRANAALNDSTQAISDYQASLDLNPNFAPPRSALADLGVLASS